MLDDGIGKRKGQPRRCFSWWSEERDNTVHYIIHILHALGGGSERMSDDLDQEMLLDACL